MATLNPPCARCTTPNHAASRFCAGCGLPLGAAGVDADAWVDVLGSDEAPDPGDLDAAPLLRDFAHATGYEAHPAGRNWRIDVPLPMGRTQAVYLGVLGAQVDVGPIVGLVSISGTANDRDPRVLLKLNAHAMAGHFAIKVLRGEEYFVVVRNLAMRRLDAVDARQVVARIAEAADGLEDRLTRGRDLF